MNQNPSPGTVKEALEFLDRFTNYEREARYPYTASAMNLERVRRMLATVGSPEKKLAVVHIAGTKGKGSTARMVSMILSTAGYRVGLYTSPHLLWKNERIQVNEEMISDQDLARALDALRPGVESVQAEKALGEVSYFELLTAAAFYHFAASKVKYAVLETGLGGRLDATNVCMPLVTVITPISLDHTDILGDTLDKIALEKAMVIKPGARVVVAPQAEAAEQVLNKRCREMNAELLAVEKFYSWKLNYIYSHEMGFDLLGKRNLPGLKTKMVGPRQMLNAATAVLACDILSTQGAKISDDTIRYGMARARLAARFQTLELAGRTLILDGAHNPESAKALAETLEMVYPGKKFCFIVGLGRDKDLAGFLAELKPKAECIFLCQANHPRAAKVHLLREKLGDFNGRAEMQPEIKIVLENLSSLTKPGSIIIITGSFFLIGEALQWLLPRGIEIQIP